MKKLVVLLFLLSISNLVFAYSDSNRFSNTKHEKGCHVNFSDQFTLGDFTSSDIKNRGFYIWDGVCENGKANGAGELTIYIGTKENSNELKCEIKNGEFISIIEPRAFSWIYIIGILFLIFIILFRFFSEKNTKPMEKYSKPVNSPISNIRNNTHNPHPFNRDHYDYDGNLYSCYVKNHLNRK